MIKYKLMFREKKGKRYYNFNPTIAKTGKYSNISKSEAVKLKKELEKLQPTRLWKVVKKN